MAQVTAAAARAPILKFDHFTVCFDGAPVLKDISFEAHESEARVILGAAGSGKTVLLKTAMGLVRPDSGKVFAFGKDLTTLRETQLFEIRSKIGMLFQESALFDSLTIAENVAYPLVNQKSIKCPKDQVRPKVQEALNFVELGQTLEAQISRRALGRHAPPRRDRARRGHRAAADLLRTPPPPGLDPITAHTHHRPPDQGARPEPHHHARGHASLPGWEPHRQFPIQFGTGGVGARSRNGDRGSKVGATFMVLREGRVVFEGNQDQLEASEDAYISKFVKLTGIRRWRIRRKFVGRS